MLLPENLQEVGSQSLLVSQLILQLLQPKVARASNWTELCRRSCCAVGLVSTSWSISHSRSVDADSGWSRCFLDGSVWI